MARFGLVLAVVIGGATGALARWGAVTAFAERETLVILALNIAGSLMLGALIGQRERMTERTFGVLGPGFCGGVTTFSTFAVDVAGRLDDGLLLSGIGTAFGTPIAAVVAAGVGYRSSRLGGAALLARTRRRRVRSRAGLPKRPSGVGRGWRRAR